MTKGGIMTTLYENDHMVRVQAGETAGTSNVQYYEYESFSYDLEKISEFPIVSKVGMERYLPLLPVESLPVQLNGKHGETPLSHAKTLGESVGLSNLWIKHEETNPTGCFKDRESAVVIAAAKEKGIAKVHVASSGNAALSTAAYAQKAGIECACFVPEKTTEEKKSLIKLFGATITEIPGFYEDVYRYVVDNKPDGWNVTSGKNYYRTEGNKTIAFELWEQMGVPDVIVVPCGNGGCLAGIWKGFVELKKLGKVSTLPQMVAVQVKDAAPLSVALKECKDFVVLGEIEDSIAEGIVAQESYCSPHAVAAIKDSGGYVVEVTDNEISQALGQVIKLESLIPEPTSAAVYAALPKLSCTPDATVVCINTGSGSKLLPEIMKIMKGGEPS